MKQRLKRLLGPVIVLLTIVGFIWYLTNNPAVGRQLASTNILVIGGLLLLNVLTFAAYVGVFSGSLRIFGKRLSLAENVRINGYASLANFFLPGQNGPIIRGAYIKVRHGVLVKQYTFATLFYYAVYALLSAGIVAAFVLPWWLTLLAILGAGVGSAAIIYLFTKKYPAVVQGLSLRSLAKPLLFITACTVLQILFLAITYFVELRSLAPSIQFSQALIYTGAANLALFVALTPGAIGIREAFVLFTERLHHIPQDVVIAASILDRAVYLVFMALLAILVLGILHARRSVVQVTPANASTESKD